ncbi:MAG TPA: dihydrolipoyl dehydrogenase [Acidimicrobiales bacterium]|nr:dihydrolipoyl dehydrogenase [Acidimicrobiales bacterium]
MWEVVLLPANETEPAHYDIVVIGGGPGGYAAALYAGAAGLSVAVVEKDKVGGTCLHRGCVPAKEFLETASVFRGVEGAKEFGIHANQPVVEFAISQDRKNRIVDQLFKGLSGLLKQRKVVTYAGVGRLLPGKVVEVTGADGAVTLLAGSSVILASGSVPRTLPGFDVDGRYVQTSDEVLSLSELPKSAAVIGGGAIGCEFASLLVDLGVQVALLEALPKILPGCDPDVANVVVRSFAKRGITVRTGVVVTGHEPDGDHTAVLLGDGERLEVETIVMSIGRRPLSDGLLAQGTGVDIDERGYVSVDEWMRTGTEGVFAVGDLVATPQLAHVGFAEAMLVVKQILGEHAYPVDYGKVPWAIYCHPEVAFVGMTEQDALDAGIEIITKRDPFGGNSRARILGETDGLVKVICEKQADGRAGRLLGVHMAGPWVTEQLGQAYLSVNWEATPDEIAPFVQPHPSLSETFGETVLALTGRGLHVG